MPSLFKAIALLCALLMFVRRLLNDPWWRQHRTLIRSGGQCAWCAYDR